MKKRKKTGAAAGIVIGIVAAISVMLIVTLVCTALLLDSKMSDSITKYIGMITNTLSSMVGFLIIGKTVEDKIAIRMGIGAAIYLIITAGIKVLLLNDGLQNYWMMLLSVIISYILSCAIYIRKGKNKRYRKKRI